ncbi:MarP family serine protease [Mycobacterium neglectum]|jgi:S1-C subfamily serine protease|uniref:MarP family serine protease n=1 Tax=Mycobacterium neglectum TaxID=242737 RepID=UPI002481EBE1|nr:MarP family serine protease [Mycobacterium neglectum]
MRWIQLAFALLAVTLGLGALAGRGAVPETVHRATELTEQVGPMVGVEPPDAALANDAVVVGAAHSVVKVTSTAHSCMTITTGSGFVVANEKVMTNAHVVAGADSFTVSVDGQDLDAAVVAYDPNADIAVLQVPGLQAPPLDFSHEVVWRGTDAVVLGYPGGGPFAAHPARVREVIWLTGPNIYRSTSVRREVYTIRGKVGQGDSGGPLIDTDGRVIGINFGAAVEDPETGFVLTTNQVYPHAVNAVASEPVPTGGCVR